MEKQPIDDLFSRKLRDAEVAPGAEVFGRLQNRLNNAPVLESQPKRRLAGWWYGVAAAGLLLALGWSYQSGNLRLRSIKQQELAHAASHKKPGMSSTVESRLQKQVILSTDGAGTSDTKAPANPTMIDSVRKVNRYVQPEPSTNEPTRSEIESARIEVVADIPEKLATQDSQLARAAVSSIESSKNIGRTIVMIIDEAEQKQFAESPSIRTEVSANSPNLGQLFAKVKQLKNGEAFARATPTSTSPDNRTGLKRFVNGVRESLRNENTLEL